MHQSRTLLAALLVLAYGNSAQAASTNIDNLTLFSGLRAGSAQEVLRQQASRYGLPASLDNLMLSKVQQSLTGKHYHYQQMLRGLPVDRAEIIVSLGQRGELNKIFNETTHISDVVDRDAVNQLYVQPRITPQDALEQGWSNMKVQHPLLALPESTLVWVKTKDGVQLAHKVQIEAQMPTGGFVQYLDAHDGTLLDSYSTSLPRNEKYGERSIAARAALPGPVLERAAATAQLQALAPYQSAAAAESANKAQLASGINGMGLVFDPDPRTVLNTDALSDASAAAAFDPAYANKTLRDLTVTAGVYKLSGPYVNITNIEAPNTGPSTTGNGVWTAKRGNNAFDDSNVYFHLDQSQRYIQSLGFVGTVSILNFPLNVDTDGLNGSDNSHYSYANGGYLAFGHGCVNDSEDADVVLHEYGHAIQAKINTSWSGGDTGAMGEGFGDYWAVSYSYSTPNGKIYHPEWVFSWDGHSACWPGRVTNRTTALYNAAKTYGAHQSVTENGVSFQSDELWSAPLYESMVALLNAGKTRPNIDKIILEAHFGLGANVKMPVMATAIVNAAHALFPNDASYEDTFRARFNAHNIPIPPVAAGPTMNEVEANNTIASADTMGAVNTIANGVISVNTDVDYFRVTIPAGKTLVLTLVPNAQSDFDLGLFDAGGVQLGVSIKGTGVNDSIMYRNTGAVAQTVYPKVYYYSGGVGGINGKYSVNVYW